MQRFLVLRIQRMELPSPDMENSGGEARVKERRWASIEGNMLGLEDLWAFDQMGNEN